MKIIKVKLLADDTMNPSDEEARKYVEDIIREAFDREQLKEYPRTKLLAIEVKHGV